MKPKVFCIGFHRTGTTTFQTALEELGYSVVGMRPQEWSAYADGRLDDLLPAIGRFDGFRDMPWPLLYRWLHETQPGARFVLTTRDPEAWAQSCLANYKDRRHAMFPRIYGFETFAGNAARAVEVYLRHNDDVRRYFAGHGDAFFETDFTSRPRWDELCRFLGEPVPARAFPHANRRPRTLLERLRYRITRTLAPSSYTAMVRDK